MNDMAVWAERHTVTLFLKSDSWYGGTSPPTDVTKAAAAGAGICYKEGLWRVEFKLCNMMVRF